MATNYSPYDRADATAPLHVDNIAVGDTLVRAVWDFQTGAWSESKWTVAKVLKARLVVERVVNRGTVEAPNLVTLTERVLVRNSRSWPHGNGEVQTRLEGQSEWSRDSFYLFTEDDANLLRLRTSLAAANVKFRARAAARKAVEKITNSPRHFTEGDALEAIAALQAFVTVHKES